MRIAEQKQAEKKDMPLLFMRGVKCKDKEIKISYKLSNDQLLYPTLSKAFR